MKIIELTAPTGSDVDFYKWLKIASYELLRETRLVDIVDTRVIVSNGTPITNKHRVIAKHSAQNVLYISGNTIYKSGIMVMCINTMWKLGDYYTHIKDWQHVLEWYRNGKTLATEQTPPYGNSLIRQLELAFGIQLSHARDDLPIIHDAYTEFDNYDKYLIESYALMIRLNIIKIDC